jgi:hypothetical protein
MHLESERMLSDLRMKFASSLLMLGALLSASTVQAAAETPITVTIDNRLLTFDQPPISVNYRTLVPFRGILEALGATVTWDEATGNIKAIRNTDHLTIEMKLNETTAFVNGKTTELDVAPAIANGRTMVPVRFLAESLGAIVRWDNPKQQVQIRTDKPIEGRTMKQIRERWEQAKPTYSGDPYLVKPSNQPPYLPGKLQDGFLQDGLKMTNFLRYLAWDPDDLELDPALTELSQYGAGLQRVIGTLNHTPAKPDGMDDTFYQKGYEASSHSNLEAGSETMDDAIQFLMQDADSLRNEQIVGHRRWLLHPNLKKIGYGYNDFMNAVYVFDSSRNPQVSYDYVAWPSKGYQPSNFFGPDVPWSVQLNKDRFIPPTRTKVTVEMTNKSTGKIWTFSSGVNSVENIKKGLYPFYSLDATNYGESYAIIFRPDYKEMTANSGQDVYEVKINGVKKLDGSDFPIQYEVDLFTL